MQAILIAFRDPTYGRLGVEVFAEATRNHKVREVLRRNEAELQAAFITALEKAQEQGQVDTNFSPKHLADFLRALIAGLSTRAIVDPDYQPVQLRPVIEACLVRFLRPTS